MIQKPDLTKGDKAQFWSSATWVVAITLFIDMTGFGIVIPLLPFYVETFQAGPTALGILVASFSFMQFVFSPILGRLSDKAGRKPVLVISILISMTSFIFFTFANSFNMLFLSRIVAGMATETAVAQAYIADTTSERERATGMGIVGAALGAGFIVGPALGGLLSVYGFSAPGYAAVALTLLNLLFVLFFLPESTRNKSVSPQITTNQVRYSGGLVNALSKPLMGTVLTILFIVTLAFSTIPVIIPMLGIRFFGFGTIEMSYFFMYIGLVQIVLQGFLMRRITKKVSEEKLMVFGPLLMMFGMFLMPLIPNVAVFLASMTMISSGNGIMRTVVPSFISKRAPAKEQGGVLGLTQSVSTIARVPGPLVGGSLFEFSGPAAPFLLGGTLLLFSFSLGYRAFSTPRQLG